MTQLTEERREDDVSNSKMSRFITLEFLLSACISIFLMGAGYMAIAGEQDSAKEERVKTNVQIKDVKVQQSAIKVDIGLIQKDIAVMANEQRHTTEAMQSNTTDIKQILRILLKYDNRLGTP